jgi:hypothetical protein
MPAYDPSGARRAAGSPPRSGRSGSPTALVIAIAAVVVIGGGAWIYVADLFGGPTPPEDEVPAPTATADWSPAPTPPPTTSPPLGPTWPLTGVAGDPVDRPVLVVKVENAEESRPQRGLEQADVVYETMVEGGIARLVALFHSDVPAEVAPIRSVRPMDGPIAGWTRGVFVFSGGQEPFIDRAVASGLQAVSMDWGDEGFSRLDDRPEPHDVVGDTATFLDLADTEHAAAPPPFAHFAAAGTADTAQATGRLTASVAVSLSFVAEPRWDWDAAAGAWLRFEGEEPALAESGVQLAAANLLVLQVDIDYLDLTDGAGNPIPESIVVGQGTGLVASAGMSAAITWQKDSESGPWQFFDATGAPLVLQPGPTWVELVPSDQGSWTVG